MSDDFLTTCTSLPTILSYLMYDDLARCMQINNNIYGCINRNWKKMNMMKIVLLINAHVDSHSTDKNISISIEIEVPSSFTFLLISVLHLSDKNTYVHNDYIEAIAVIFNILLPRVNILHARVGGEISGEYRCFELNELAAMLNSLQENYTAKNYRTVVPYFRNGNYQPIFADIAVALDTRKFEIQLYKEGLYGEEIPQRFTFVDLNTREFHVKLVNYNWQLDEIVHLLEDWKSGNRSILDLKVRRRDSNASRTYDWDRLCTMMGVRSVTGDGYRKLCTSRFELRRDIDNKILDVTYYKFGDNLDIEELL